jgi:hypothetical protein
VTLDVPAQPKPATLRLRVHADQAVSASPGWANHLSGNEGDKQFNGEDPNDNDYVLHLQCGSGLDLKVDGVIAGKPVSGQIVGYPAPILTCEPLTAGGRVVGSIVHWSGETSTTHTQLGGEFDNEFGTMPVGTAIGDASITINSLNPYELIGGVSGTITQNPGGGSIDATAAAGPDEIHVTGTWTCPPATAP